MVLVALTPLFVTTLGNPSLPVKTSCQVGNNEAIDIVVYFFKSGKLIDYMVKTDPKKIDDFSKDRFNHGLVPQSFSMVESFVGIL